MPSWPADGRDDEIWHLVAFLRALPKMPAKTFRQLALANPAPNAAAPPFGPPPALRAYALRNDNEPPIGNFAYRAPTFGFSGLALNGDVTATCTRCHGAEGAGGGVFPNLTLQNSAYLAGSLTAYATGRRRSGFMRMVASELSPSQIAALAQHYASLPRRSTEPAAGPVPAIGQQIALTGIPTAGRAACASCHGVTRAAAKAYPLLEGQARWYLANQMRVFRAGGRGGMTVTAGQDPMVAIARQLSDQQIDSVAAYYAAQLPALKQSFAPERTAQ